MSHTKRAAHTWTVADGMMVFETHDAMDAERIERLERLAFEHGRYSESYLITEPNRSYLWSSNGDGVVGFVRKGKYVSIVGGLIAPDADKPKFLQEIAEFAKLNKVTLVFYHVDDRDLPVFEAAGFQITKFGVEARISLKGHSWSGKAYEWVRRQFNFVTRHGIAFEEWAAADVSPTEWEQRLGELHEVSAEHISTKHFRGEIPFFEGRLLNQYLYRRRCFVARADEGRGRVEGFVLCTPIDNGRQWAIEMYRQRTDAVRGVIPYLMHQTIEHLKREGCEGVSMCPVPAIGCEQKRPGDSWIARTSLVLWNRLGSALFDTNGLYHYKSRFRPEFRNIYVCVWKKASIGSVWGYVQLTRALDLRLGRFIADWISLLNPQRRTLAKPVLTPQPMLAGEIAASPAAAHAESKAA